MVAGLGSTLPRTPTNNSRSQPISSIPPSLPRGRYGPRGGARESWSSKASASFIPLCSALTVLSQLFALLPISMLSPQNCTCLDGPGGFPCPNLSAPTPFSLTPAATPCASPGLKTSFGSVTSLSALTTLPALNPTKPRVVHVERLRARAERQRLADYTLKPRFEFAFGTWGSHVIEWRLDGEWSSMAIGCLACNAKS